MTTTPVSDLTYAQAIEELEQIIAAMQSDKCDIDKLTSYTRRAAELLRACRQRLTATDDELKEILTELQA